MNGATLLGSNAKLLAEIRAMFHAGQAAGEFDPARTEPTGAEWALWNEAGFALLTYAGPGLGAVDLIYVRPEYRRHGHGRALLAAAVAAARAQGLGSVILGLTNDNAPMRALTASLGFAEAGVIVQKVL